MVGSGADLWLNSFVPTKNKNMPKKIVPSKRLRLVHRSHTGKLLHKSHTSYPLVAILLLMVGVLLTSTTIKVRAEDVVVTATSKGPLPITRAVILKPEQDARFSSPGIPVSGTCEPDYFVSLYRNDLFSGSGVCSQQGTFQISTDLFPGRNDLRIRTSNAAGEEGPPSIVTTVYYDVPGGAGGTSGPPYYLAADYFFKASYAGRNIDWQFSITGGTAPYTIYVSWGDGSSEVLQNVGGKNFTLKHTYVSLQDSRQYFTVNVRAVDKDGREASLQMFAAMNDPAVIAAGSSKGPLAFIGGGLLGVVWSAYGIVVLMGVCFYLGERRGESIGKAFYRKQRVA